MLTTEQNVKIGEYDVPLLITKDNGEKIGLEILNEYTHANRPKKYQQNKMLYLEEQGIQLMSIPNVVYMQKEEKFLNLLDNQTQPLERIFARKCELREVEKNEAKEFIENFHWQGYNQSVRYRIGLYYKDQLMQVMTLGVRRYYGGWEINRMAVRNGYQIVGGAGKLLKYFMEKEKPESLLTYSDCSLFSGKTYKALGFKFISVTEPDYIWVNPQTMDVLPREACQVQKLLKKYPELVEKHTEIKSVENRVMTQLRYLKIYLCGNKRWEMSYDEWKEFTGGKKN